jgi:hypothetical protein
MRIIIISNDLPDITFVIGVGPSGTFPKTHFTVSGGSIDLSVSSYILIENRPIGPLIR